jgi:hypothetical protein
MDDEVRASIERKIVLSLGIDYKTRCETRELNPGYLPNQLAALVGELASPFVDPNYAREKAENVLKMLGNIYPRI